MERIIVKTNDEFNPDTKVFGDFHESYGGKLSKVNTNEDSTLNFSIRGGRIHSAVNNEMIPEIMKNLEVGDFVSTITYFTPEDSEVIVQFYNFTKDVEIINETSYGTYLKLKERNAELKRIKEETQKLEEEAAYIKNIYAAYEAAQQEISSNFLAPFFTYGDMIMTISKFIGDEKRELISIFALPYNTPLEYVEELFNKYTKKSAKLKYEFGDLYLGMKSARREFVHVEDEYELFISPVLVSYNYWHGSGQGGQIYRGCNPKVEPRYVWSNEDGYQTACDACFLKAKNITIPHTLLDSFDLDDHIISHQEIYDKYGR